MTWSSSTQQPLYIYATAFCIAITCQTTAISGTFSSPACALEVDNTLGTFIAGYPTTFTWSSANDTTLGTGPKIKNPKAAGDLTTTNTFFVSSSGLDNTQHMGKGRVYRDGSEVVRLALLRYFITATTSNSTADFNYGACGQLLGKIRFGSGLLATPVTLDTVVIGSTTYILFYLEAGVAAQLTQMWVPQG